MDKTMTVTELTTYIKQLVDSDMLLSNVWITGEISNYKFHTSGHMYFSLKDQGAVIKCVMFRTQNSRLKFRPEEGMRVIARGYVSVYPQGGSYQLYVDAMQPDGTGALYMAFEQLKIKLESQGLFDESRKKKIPLLPNAIGVITSPTGAVIKDITQILNRRYYNTRLIVYGSAVQGTEAPTQLIEGIRYFNKKKNVDVIILARGGGSLEDLWPFNDEKLAIAISQSEIPVISAVGHETDFSISDFVADLRAPTPSAAAELVMPEKKALKDALSLVEKRLINCLTNGLKRERDRLARLQSARSLQKPLDIINQKRQSMDTIERNLILLGRTGLERARNSLKTAIAQLNALSPLTVLSRGYGVIHDVDGRLVRSVKKLKSGDKLVITMTDGKFEAVCDKLL
ncbi:MAG: exodeoxyribonuclease VII large subunit [Acetivibrionales bacterium]|jgi:exodeoxyribonuclease VII large subunit